MKIDILKALISPKYSIIIDMGAVRTIVITGATGGIGQTIVKKLASGTNQLVLVGRNLEALDKIVEKKSITPPVVSFAVDLENKSARKQLCDDLVAQFGTIDWVIHSAGFVSKEDSISKLDLEVTQKTFEINFFAALDLTTRLNDHISEAGGSIFISSTAGLSGNGFVPAYASAKGALNTFAKSLALSWQGSAKRSVTICPGPTNTPMREYLAGDSAEQQSPSVIAREICQIIEDAKTYPNGSTLLIRDEKTSFV
ncbi:MAG: SDR family oxidoreductase [Patescibacteria group bacterium]